MSRIARAGSYGAVSLIFGILLLAAPFFVQKATETNEPNRAGRFSAALDSLTAGAAIGADKDSNDHEREMHFVSALFAPKGLCSLAQRPEFRVLSQKELGFRCSDGRISLYWSGELSVLGPHPDANGKLIAALKEGGFSDVEGQLTSHLRREYEIINNRQAVRQRELNLRRENLCWPWTYARNAGRAKEEMLVHSLSPKIGGRQEACGGRFDWCVVRDYSSPPPTLRALVEALPTFELAYLEPVLYERLQDAPVYDFSIDRMYRRTSIDSKVGWSLLTSTSLQRDVESAFEKLGFVRGEEIELPQAECYGERTQFTWRRGSDATFASVITMARDKDRIYITCQAPQRRVKP